MRRMKVLMIGNCHSVKGGITSVITQLMNHGWNDEGIDMKFIPSYIETGTISKSIYFAIAYFKIIFSILTFSPDIIHIHMSYKGSFHRKYLIHKLCKVFGKKDIIHLHGSEFKKFYDETDNRTKQKIIGLLRECDAMIVLGEAWDKMIKTIEPSTNTIVVHNTVKLPDETVIWDKECFTTVFLGVLIKRKGVSDLLDAISLMKKDGLLDNRNYKFMIVGSGPEEDNLKKKCLNLQIASYVEFVGWIDGDKKEEILINSQMFILPSYNEGLPVAILEAISYGLPVISTNVGSINEAVIDGFNGYLVEPGDIFKINEVFREISKSEILWDLFKENSISLARRKFDEKQYFEGFKELYENI